MFQVPQTESKTREQHQFDQNLQNQKQNRTDVIDVLSVESFHTEPGEPRGRQQQQVEVSEQNDIEQLEDISNCLQPTTYYNQQHVMLQIKHYNKVCSIILFQTIHIHFQIRPIAITQLNVHCLFPK